MNWCFKTNWCFQTNCATQGEMAAFYLALLLAFYFAGFDAVEKLLG